MEWYMHTHVRYTICVLFEITGWLTIISNNYLGGCYSMGCRCHNCATKMDFYSARHSYVKKCYFITFCKKITFEILLDPK